MFLFEKRVDQLLAEDTLRLVNSQIKENKTLEYKRDLKFENSEDKREFLFDFTSMYNTDGGCIIYGIEDLKDNKKQNTGIPKIHGITIENEDKLLQKIEDTIRSNTEPSINNIGFKKLIINDETVLVIGVPKGLGLPCMVTFNQTNKFYKRRNTGKYPVDVYELNQMFMQNMVLKESVEKFREERTKKVITGKILPKLDISTSLFAHIFPFNFVNEQIIDLSGVYTNSKITEWMKPLHATGWSYMYNLDGFLTYCTRTVEDENSLQPNHYKEKIISYNQLLRNGIYEIYSSHIIAKIDKHLHLYENELNRSIEAIKNGLCVLETMKIEPPFYVSYSLHGLLNAKLIYNGNTVSSTLFTTNEVFLPAVLIQNYDSDIKELLKPVFDILWQAVGLNKNTII
ncbi:MAG: ATP-binding protein [Paludibacter sp.]|nr:ATP-binding protein [Paludibacter sp.]